MMRWILLLSFLFSLAILIVAVLYQIFISGPLGIKMLAIDAPGTVSFLFLRLTGFLALTLLGANALLGAFRPLLVRIYGTARFWRLHTLWISSLGLAAALTHLIFNVLYRYRVDPTDVWSAFLLTSEGVLADNNLRVLGLLVLAILTMNLTVSHMRGMQQKRWWRPLHMLNYLAILFALVHAFLLGSDSHLMTVRVLYVLLAVLLVFGFLFRARRSHDLHKRKEPNPSSAFTVGASIEKKQEETL